MLTAFGIQRNSVYRSFHTDIDAYVPYPIATLLTRQQSSCRPPDVTIRQKYSLISSLIEQAFHKNIATEEVKKLGHFLNWAAPIYLCSWTENWIEKERRQISNTISGALTSAVKFLTFIEKHDHQNLETMKRSDIEAFVEYEQDRGITAGTISTNLTCLYAFIRFLVDDDVLNRELLKRKIHIKQPKRLPKSIGQDDEDRILAQIDNVRDNALNPLAVKNRHAHW